jgi:predicted ATP-dependent endonuclease of OLD family
MKIKSVTIKNFRAIKEQQFNTKELSILIGNNGTGKTSVLEAIHYALSPYFVSNRIKPTDFHNGSNDPIVIELEFDYSFIAELPDGYTTQKIECNKIHLEIKKRDKAAPNKAFSDGFITSHYAVPINAKANEKGWSIKRKGNTYFKFTERHLVLSNIQTEKLPRSFYFNKNREQQLKKGYNSSISSVFEDFNWRFLKTLRKDEKPEMDDDFITRKTAIENEILEKIDDKAIKKSFQELNRKLQQFGLDDSRISFIDGHAPFDSAFLSQSVGSLDLGIANLGSGIEMIISVLFLETLASLSKENIIILIDEPELHLHPHLQEIFVQYLKELSETEQTIISTHSPYFFKNCIRDARTEPLIMTTKDKECLIGNSEIVLNRFPWSPSWGEINYFAYGLPTIEFHNELYGYLQYKNGAYKIKDLEKLFESKGLAKCKKWVEDKGGQRLNPKEVTLMTYIRNSIHHPENQHNFEYMPEELKESINIMLSCLNNE